MAHNKAKAKLDIDTDDLIPVAYKSKQQPEKLEAWKKKNYKKNNKGVKPEAKGVVTASKCTKVNIIKKIFKFIKLIFTKK